MWTCGTSSGGSLPGHAYSHVIDMCIDMCINMCMNMCINMCIDRCIEIRTDMCIGMCRVGGVIGSGKTVCGSGHTVFEAVGARYLRQWEDGMLSCVCVCVGGGWDSFGGGLAA